MNIKKAVFPVAGFGTRFLPATKATPKEMLPIIDKPIIQYAVEEALEAGINEFIFVTHHAKRAIEDHFDENLDLKQRLKNDGKDDLLKLISKVGGKDSKFTFVRQDEPKGLGHAISCAQHLMEKNEYFAVILADDLIISEGKNVTSQLIDRVQQEDRQALALETVPTHDISKFGVISFSEQQEDVFQLSGIVEKPDPSEAPSDLAVVGRYIFNQSIFNSIDEKTPGKNGEIQITDAIEKQISDFVGIKFQGQRYDCGSKIGYLKANIELGLKHPEISEDLKNLLKEYCNL
ncbi:MAG: UTP--glucose-1-phosphate uridylyltransferase [SAR86 cluster bacterium]|uniref:UTP--glucose-1-phosphate uridylyltransferase n=1 Tax=SAR86 cluster bacterium TaxID=2030880 RepID=A0A368BKA0_9GAMM|nr:MAG: UTP--glucose-1-phosphate uridylyltransferase [SAR86 cluster bacterium]|tara:strand:+ start:6271 stop:7140 length:870 start_codon:yes stop_codon:yes gene_type:complete